MTTTEEKPEDEYAIHCIQCWTTKGLSMVAHRNKHGLMVGWIFACSLCVNTVFGRDIVLLASST